MLSAAAGMGGGGVYVPLLLLLCGFSTQEAVPLSQAMIVGGAVVNIVMFCGERPADPRRPRIDYDVVMMLNPGLAAGGRHTRRHGQHYQPAVGDRPGPHRDARARPAEVLQQGDRAVEAG
ncbi:unnamed protein product, partial [Prorocentrum cordatum]